MERDPWRDVVYGTYNYFFADWYIERRKRVDDMQLGWLDVEACYKSPEVIIFSKEDILEKSNWSEDEVKMLFLDKRFPMTEVSRKQVVEIHALIQFFARKALIKAEQIAEEENREHIFAQLHI